MIPNQPHAEDAPLLTGGQSPPSPGNLPNMQEWPLLPISEVMNSPSWQDGHMLWKADDPAFEKLSVLDLCVDYFFHERADGPVCHRVAVLTKDVAAERDDDSETHGRIMGLKCAAVLSMSDVVRLVFRDHLGVPPLPRPPPPPAPPTLQPDVVIPVLGVRSCRRARTCSKDAETYGFLNKRNVAVHVQSFL